MENKPFFLKLKL